MRIWPFFTIIVFAAPGLAEGTSYPCEFDIIVQIMPVIYDGQQRNNPDGTYYPGDALNYIIKYPNIESCFQPVIHEPKHSNNLELDSHIYEDDNSITIFNHMLDFNCKFNYCTTGHVEIIPFSKIGLEDMEFSAGGWRVICESMDDGESCKYTRITKKSFFSINITDPKLTLHMEKKFINDSDGYNATNMDGTHYMWDPIVVYSIPTYNWQNERSKTLFMKYEKNTMLDMMNNHTCVKLQCFLNLSLSGFMESNHNLTYTHDITVYNATDQHMIRNHIISHNAILLSVSGKEITARTAENEVLVVSYKPVFKTYPYLVLADGQSASWDNRHGIAIFYSGSEGLGINDDHIVHDKRRSKMNGFAHTATAMKLNEMNPIGIDVIWSEAHGTEIGKSGYCTKKQIDYNVIESKSLETAMFIRSGYGSLIFDLPISHIMKNPLYSHAQVNGDIISVGFAGNNNIKIFNYEYTYPDVLFGNNISLIAISPNGQILENVPVSIKAMPNLKMSGVSYTHDYVCDKIEFDTDNREMADLVISDMYSKEAYSNSFGNVTLYLPRISTWNIFDSNDFFSKSINEGYNSPSPYVIRFFVGEKIRTYTFSYMHAGDHTYVANQNKNNTLHIEDNRAGILVNTPYNFGHMVHIKINGKNYNHAVNCLDSCVLPTPKNSVLIEAYNVWGGRAFASYVPAVIEEDDWSVPNLYSLAVIAIGGIIMWRTIRWAINTWIKYHNN